MLWNNRIVLSFLFLVHRQRPPRRLLLRRRSPWPWPTMGTWTCKQTLIPHAHREALSLQTGVSLPSHRWLMTISPLSPQGKNKKSRCWRLVEALEPSSFTGSNLHLGCLVFFFCVSFRCREGWKPQRLLVTFKDKTTEHLTFDFVSSCRIFVKGNVTRLLGKQAFLFRTLNK